MKRKASKRERSIKRLYYAVESYVKNSGGKVVVIGGIQIEQFPTDLKDKFSVSVLCMGKLPAFAKR